jgi:peptidoglycan-associated lipoprotein
MKKNWLGYAALILLAISLAACEQAGTVKKPEAAKAAEAAKMGIDKSKLPPPRLALSDTPDLKNARFEITDRSIELMREDGVDDKVLTKLEALKGNTYGNAEDFTIALGSAIGEKALAASRLSIMRNSIHVDLAVEPPFPGADLKLVALQPEGSAGFGAVYFDFDKANIKPEFGETLAANARRLIDDPDLKVMIEGHCDERGTTEYNLALGERRANAVREALIANGVNPGQLQTVTFGEERPADPGHGEAAWAKNRRGILVLQ